MKLSTKIILSVIFSIIITNSLIVFSQKKVIESQGIDLLKQKMRTALLEAEDVRQSISKLNQVNNEHLQKLFLEEIKEVGDYHKTSLYASVPIIATSKALDTISKSENFIFRVVRQNPRNPINAPNSQELDILKFFEDPKNTDFFLADKKNNQIVYARPIYLTQDCLTCHGDPANSPTKDGKDLIGFPMENWKAGQMRGAYILTSDYSSINNCIKSGLMQIISITVPTAFLLSIAFYFFSKRLIVKPLQSAIEKANQNVEETENTSSILHSSSQSLAQGACEQAASLEETSASLEIIANLTKVNSSNVTEASRLASQTESSALDGNNAIQEMIKAMEEISQSSKHVSRVIKTIDEIAFQTNILAINASIEAARAGEMGASFAVVADEVRRLAERCALAAKETSSLIENSNTKIHHGSNICSNVTVKLTEIIGLVKNLNHLIQGVANSSLEQTQGIEQINKAVSQIDEVTQQSAHKSEENYKCAESIKEQAQKLKEAFDAIHYIINGSKF